MAVPRFLVVGLGNAPFPLTRHSVGQTIIDGLAVQLGIKLQPEGGGSYGEANTTFGPSRTPCTIALYKTKAFMNVSGPPVAAMFRKTVKYHKNLIVVHDSLSHKPETVSYKLGGSANGHNGVRSVIASIGSQDFHRIRAGIGRDLDVDVAEYVLRKLPQHERQFWNGGEGIDLVMSEIEKIILKHES